MKTINEILRNMSEIRHRGGSVLTNYYNQCNGLDNKFNTWQAENTVVFEWIDDGIKRIYFYSTDCDELERLLAYVSSGSVIDYVTKKRGECAELFRNAGYKLRFDYGRFCVKPISKEAQELRTALQSDNAIVEELYDAPYGEMAKIEDAEEIDKQLREEFDPVESHFYSLDKLRDHIKKGWVWVAKQDGKIIAANLYEIQGKKSYGAYLYNRGGVDVLCSLIAKTDQYVAKLGVTYHYCWMRLNNRRILRYNMKYNGYVPDGLFDMIYEKV